jgi:superfamily II RNA helicase
MIKVEKINETFLRVFCDQNIAQELSEYFTFELPGARFMPAVHAKIFDGKIRLYNLQTKTLYVGLLSALKYFADQNDYTIEYLNEVESVTNITKENVIEFVNSLNLYGSGKKIEVRDYQYDAIFHGLRNERVLLLSPTSSGKSAMIYAMMRYHLAHHRKCIIIVPTTSLVFQLKGDFEDYSSKNKWNAEDNIGIIMGGYSKNPITKIISFVMEDDTIRKFKSHDLVLTNRGKIFAMDVTTEDELL